MYKFKQTKQYRNTKGKGVWGVNIYHISENELRVEYIRHGPVCIAKGVFASSFWHMQRVVDQNGLKRFFLYNKVNEKDVIHHY